MSEAVPDRDPREWLEADGLGGFAMGTPQTTRTRRYHALLLAAMRPPEGRMVLVADTEVWVETAAGRVSLSSHDYRGGFTHPDGKTRITRFVHDPWPTWEWDAGGGTVIRGELVVAPGCARVLMRWTRIAGRGACALTVRPLLAGRDYHNTHHQNDAFKFDAHVDGDRVRWQPYADVSPIVATSNGTYAHAPDWYRDFHLSLEEQRGLDCYEDLASPGVLTFDLAEEPAALAFATEQACNAGALDPPAPPFGGAAGAAQVPAGGGAALALVTRVFAAEQTRRASYASALHRAADTYLVARGHGMTVIAGYPWFADWGRDTFISLRGLCLATGRRDVARAILLQWCGVVSEGMCPNRFDENNSTPEFNSVDAALWFVVAADAYLSGATEAADRDVMHRAIDQIVSGYAAGTRHRIKADRDGLLAAGEPGVQLTWMDAKCGDTVITPRIGKPVEVNALWINALAIAGRRSPKWRELAETARVAFVSRFWDDERRQLYDVVDCDHLSGTVDATVRPNQIFAVGLPFPVLDGDRARAVVDTVEKLLWTVAGPRTLAEKDPRFHPQYGGGPLERDSGYHNGPVWPWLAGAFVEAWVRVRGDSPAVRAEARTKFLAPMLERMELFGLGHLSEICDGAAPHLPKGAPFQAWSVAEALRLDHIVLR
jgi:glycogen debranching enzyme